MNLLDYTSCDLHKGTEYSDWFRLNYEAENGYKQYASFQVLYNPKNRKITIKKSETFGTIKNLFEAEEEFDKLYEHLMNKYKERMDYIYSFYDKVYVFLLEGHIELNPISIKDINGNKVRFLIKTYNESYDFNIELCLKNGEELNHFNIHPSDDSYFISFHAVSDYLNIQAATKKIIEESEFRLKLLLDE
ncbi:hypothetical protein [Bacillus thuringiensis]|uniref:hypothetical protein n=1 Tax=Bacillus thuringiensis TaxID=1428 RepID=UPI0021D64868|nr:hypothetical protein [Bacillus thuringiensis]MCU7667596.1 hypothetical protein [Bacillus thuringiensis]